MQEKNRRSMPFAVKFAPLLAALALSGAALAAAPQPHVLLKTSMGEIELELDHDKAPATVDNFLRYVGSGFYKGTIFHRVIDGFMIQGGGFDAKLTQKPTSEPIRNDAQNGLHNVRYSIAMARTGDPDSATSQFFINVNDNRMLDYPNPDRYGYTVFGKVVRGMNVVDKIKSVPTGNSGPHQNLPRTPIVIEAATLLDAGTAGKTVK